MPEYNDGLGGLSDLARALNRDEEWERKQAKTRADLRRSTNELLSHAEKLRESVDELAPVTRIHQEPTAEVALTEDELQDTLVLIDATLDHGSKFPYTAANHAAYSKMKQALALESGSGGRFDGDGAA